MKIIDHILQTIGLLPETPAIDYAHGIDLSWWEGSFHPERATKKISFAFTKFTEGTTHIDPKVDVIWQGISQLLGRGGFHYQRSGYSWRAQADHFLSVANRFADCQFFILDVERNKFLVDGVYVFDNKYDDAFFADMRRILDYWHEVQPKKLRVLYTNVDTYQNYIYPAMQRLYGDEGIRWLNSILLWIAQPGTEPGKPNMPKQRSQWDFHQYSFVGKKEDYGTEGAVDENVFNGTVADLQKLIGGEIQTPPTDEPPIPPVEMVDPETESTVYMATVQAGPIIVRKHPLADVSTQTTLRVNVGEVFQGRIWSGNGYVWLQIGTSSRPELWGLWVAVRKQDGTGKLIKLLPLNVVTPADEIAGSRIFETRSPLDALMLQKIGLAERVNFVHAHMYSAKANNFGDVIFWLTLSDEWKTYLLDMQPKDQTILDNGKEVPVTRNMQLNWLYDPKEGRPYFDKDGKFSFGACVVAGQPIRIRTHENGEPIITYFENVRLKDGIYKKVAMVKIAGFTPALKNKPIQWLKDHAYIVEWNAINAKGVIHPRPRGKMYQVVWDPDAFPGNGGEMFIPLFYLKGYEL